MFCYVSTNEYNPVIVTSCSPNYLKSVSILVNGIYQREGVLGWLIHISERPAWEYNTVGKDIWPTDTHRMSGKGQ
jgi:hypothetical protein